mgnify:FL=1|nr:MAG TPA: stabilization protein [Caudoviricetes sp.]
MPKITVNQPNPPTVYTKRYDRFAGVDFSTDPSRIDDSRSPHAVNLISDAGGYPEKRVGWRTLVTLTDSINGLFWFGTKHCYLVHAGTKLYKWDGASTPVLLKSGVKDARSTALVMKQNMILLTGAEYLVFDGETVKAAGDMATVPLVLTGRETYNAVPSAAFPGNAFQPINMLTPKRKIGFAVPEDDPNKKIFNVGTSIDNQESIKITWAASGASVIGGGTNWITDVDLANGVITLQNPVGASNPAGTDRVIVEFEHAVDGYPERIAKCSIMTNFSNRVFFTGNPDYPNTDWYCELNDPLYVSDISYTQIGDKSDAPDGKPGAQVGATGSAITGYTHIGDQLAIFKEDNGQDATIFLRSARLTDSGVVFPITQGIGGDGLLSRTSIARLHDDPLFLTRGGVMALASQDVTAERVVQARSSRVNAQLLRENGLSDAASCVWNGYYLLCVNGHVYVADGRQKTYARNLSGAYEYEWYYWENIPARVFCEHEGNLLFGTADGKLCRMNTDRTNPRGGYDMTAYSDDGAAIVAEWATKLDDDGAFNVLKTLRRNGSGVYVKSFDASNIKVLVRTDHDFGEENTQARRGIFNFKHLDFANLTFNTLPNGFVMFGKKVKKYRLIQVICRNDAVNQGFGVYAIERRFVRGYFGR